MSSTIFSGTSRYSSDFTSIISRTVQIASLPLTQMQNQQATLQDQQTAWSSLQTRFTSLRTSLTSLVNINGPDSNQATSSDIATAKGTATASALAGTYALTVSDVGTKSTVLGTSGVANPDTTGLAAATDFTLTANGESFTVSPGAQTLTSLVNAINAKTDANVQATIVNVAASGQTADYRISLQSNKYNADAITLTYDDGGVAQQLTGSSVVGSPVTYRVNGYPVATDPPLSSETRTVSIAPGLSVDIIKAGNADIKVGRNSTGLSNAISTFVNSFNSAIDEVDKQRGKSAGVLKGQTSISVLGQTLRDMVNYTASGPIGNMADVGLKFGQDGKLQFDSSVISGMSAGEISSASAFLGNGQTTGLLKTASSALSRIDDSSHGVLPNEIKLATDQIAAQAKKIDADQDRIDALQASLVIQMSAADALIASMEQQVTYFTNMFESMRTASQAYN